MRDRVATLVSGGEAAARDGRKAIARRKFRAALFRDPSNVTALLWLAWLADDPRDSLIYAYRLLAHDPGSAQAYAALRWARRRAESLPARASPPPPGSARQATRRWSRVVTAVAACLLVAFGGDAGNGMMPAASPASAAAHAAAPTTTPPPAPTRTAIPTWTPTPTVLPTARPAPPHTPSPPPPPVGTPAPLLPTVPSLMPPPTLAPESFPDDLRWIEVNLTQQTLNVYEGQQLVRTALVSTGKQDTPTPTGLFRIQIKMRYDDMRGSDYYLPNVPYVMYFHRGYGLHGTYWHANFGHPMSHGCVNLPTTHAKWLFHWADVGTLVYVHE